MWQGGPRRLPLYITVLERRQTTPFRRVRQQVLWAGSGARTRPNVTSGVCARPKPYLSRSCNSFASPKAPASGNRALASSEASSMTKRELCDGRSQGNRNDRMPLPTRAVAVISKRRHPAQRFWSVHCAHLVHTRVQPASTVGTRALHSADSSQKMTTQCFQACSTASPAD